MLGKTLNVLRLELRVVRSAPRGADVAVWFEMEAGRPVPLNATRASRPQPGTLAEYRIAQEALARMIAGDEAKN